MLPVEGKIVVTFHGHDLTKHIAERGNDLYKTLFKKGDLFLPISQRFEDKLIQYGCDKTKISVHRTGVDFRKFNYSPGKSKNHNRVRILTVGRLVEIKGIEFGIRAVSIVLNKYKDLDYGIAGDGPLKENLLQLIEFLNVGSHITLLGWQTHEEIIKLLRETDILLAPSVSGSDGNQEGIPVVIMEALALRIPVLSTTHGGIPELVQDGESGFLVPERNVDALAGKLEFLINNPETRSEMGTKGQKFVEEHYNVEKWNDRLVELYRRLKLENSRTGPL
jgi:colanic acid/amylovoran biosynthesis glycosyltransferase